MSTNTANFTTSNGIHAASGNNRWAPRKTESLTCPSGQQVLVRRPGPEFTLKVGRVARTFTAALSQKPKREDETDERYNQRIFDEMSDEELDSYLTYGRHLLVAMCVSPRLVLEPRHDRGEIGPDDLGQDFWFLLDHGMRNFLGINVPTGETEVEADTLNSFRTESGVPGHSVDGIHVQTEPERDAGDQGPVDSPRV